MELEGQLSYSQEPTIAPHSETDKSINIPAPLKCILMLSSHLHLGIRNSLIFTFSFSNPFSRTMAMRSTQPLTEMRTRNLPKSKGRPASKADNLTAICEPIV
jgi:hypothetical protein